MKKFDIKRPDSKIWDSTIGTDIYEAAEVYADGDMEDKNSVVYEIREQGKDKIWKVKVFMDATYSAYDEA